MEREYWSGAIETETAKLYPTLPPKTSTKDGANATHSKNPMAKE
jgi:hypothetical protein